MLRGCFLFRLLFRQFRNLGESGKHIFVSLQAVGQCAVGADFDALIRIAEISAAPVAQGIQRAIAKQAVKFPVILHLMAGKIRAFPILKKTVIVLHEYSSGLYWSWSNFLLYKIHTEKSIMCFLCITCKTWQISKLSVLLQSFLKTCVQISFIR